MQLFFAIILLLLAVVPAQILFQKFDKIPVFFFQIAIGWLLSYFPLYQHFTIAPEIFLLVVISTLMFSDSRRVNLGRFARSLRSTLSLAINLVVMSILVVGTVAHLITPQLSWFGGFMLAAILSPTDAVAYQSITAGTPLPKYLDNMLQNESLLNDASGLVAFNLALSALTTGHFSLVSGIGDFIYVFIGGIILGLTLGWLFMFCRRWLIIHEINTNMIIVPYIMATPYIVYFVAEELKMSGILAVVAAGLLRTWEQNNWQLSTAQTQNTDFAVEGMVNSILNGTVFVIMGLNLPSIIKLANTHNVSIVTSILIGILLYLALFGLRVFWFSSGIVPQKTKRHDKALINGLLAGINGVHGTVTLMMALSIPLTVTGLSADLRAAIILITLTVVILSMLMPMFVTPLLLKGYPKTPIHHSEKQVIWQELVQDSLRRIESLRLSEDVQNYLRVLIVTQRKLPHVSQKELLNLYRVTDRLENTETQKLLQTRAITTGASEYHSDIIKREIMNQQLTPWTAIIYWWNVLNSTHSSKQMGSVTNSGKTLFRQQERIELASYHKIMEYLLKQNSGSPEANVLARIYVTRHDDTSTVEKVNQERFYMIQLFSSEIEYVRQQYWRNRLTLSESRSMIYDISLQQTIFIRRHFK